MTISRRPNNRAGEEIVYVIEGTLEYQIEGRPPVMLKAGEVLFIPAGTIHAARNVGNRNGAELSCARKVVLSCFTYPAVFYCQPTASR